MNKKSVLFVNPDYHTSFVYRDALRNEGWKADIYVPPSYPDHMLFSREGILRIRSFPSKGVIAKSLNMLLSFVYFNFITLRYKYQVHYGALSAGALLENQLLDRGLIRKSFMFSLQISKTLRRKIIYIPSGCRDEELRTEFEKLDNGSVCGNCGFSDRCNDQNIVPNLDRVRRYADLVVGNGFFEPSKLRSVHFKYKVIDLNRWAPMGSVDDFPGEKLRILHSHSLGTRSFNNLNIKGSVEIIEAIKRLADEFSHVEFMEVSGVQPDKMVLQQQRADIIVDQLRYGYWGSTGIEALALGKVLVCYIRPNWKNFFLKQFPEHRDIPVVHAKPGNVYEVLRQLVLDKSKRDELSHASRAFAEKQYDPVMNTRALIRLFESL
jgi:glycosyltransferase involved in cell wall biosynthesis